MKLIYLLFAVSLLTGCRQTSSRSTDPYLPEYDSLNKEVVQEMSLPGNWDNKTASPAVFRGVLTLDLAFPKRKNALLVEVPYQYQVMAGAAGPEIRLLPLARDMAIELLPVGSGWGGFKQGGDTYQNIGEGALNAEVHAGLTEKRTLVQSTSGATIVTGDNPGAYRYGLNLGNGFKVHSVETLYNNYTFLVRYALSEPKRSARQPSSFSYLVRAQVRAVDAGPIQDLMTGLPVGPSGSSFVAGTYPITSNP